MRLVHWDPFQDLRHWPSFKDAEGAWAPVVDIFEQGDDLVVRAEVPGVKRDGLDVKVDGNTLVLSGERLRDKDAEEGQNYRRERSYGSFVRSFTLPKTVDSTRISAVYRDGVLDVRIPKAEDAKPRQIEVKVA